MASKEQVEEGLERVAAKLEDPKLREEFRRFSKTVQFVYPDINLAYVMRVVGGKAEIMGQTTERPNVVVTMDSDTFLAILNKETNGIQAYSAGKIRYKGAMVDLLKLQKLL